MNARYFPGKGAVLGRWAATFTGIALAQAPVQQASRPKSAATATGDNPVLTGQPEPPPTILTPQQSGDPEVFPRGVAGVVFGPRACRPSRCSGAPTAGRQAIAR